MPFIIRICLPLAIIYAICAAIYGLMFPEPEPEHEPITFEQVHETQSKN